MRISCEYIDVECDSIPEHPNAPKTTLVTTRTTGVTSSQGPSSSGGCVSEAEHEYRVNPAMLFPVTVPHLDWGTFHNEFPYSDI